MLLFYYIILVKHKKNFDSPILLECLIIWNGWSIFFSQKYPISTQKKRQDWVKVSALQIRHRSCRSWNRKLSSKVVGSFAYQQATGTDRPPLK